MYFKKQVYGVGVFFLPESPRYLISVGQEQKALESLAQIYITNIESEIVRDELRSIKTSMKEEANLKNQSTYRDCFRGGAGQNRFRTLSGLILQGLPQITG